MPEPVVELLGLEKTYKDFWGRPKVRALHPLTLDLQPGEILALLGPNGAGKSTTIKLILGLLFPTRGRVRVFGGSPREPRTRARLGYLPEETKLHKFLDARETLDLFGRLHGLSRPERKRRIAQLIAMVGLEGNDRRPVGEFSKGMARRIGLAVALSGDPDLLILDEPTSGLDPLGTREIKTLMQELRARGRTILLSSHLLDDVEDVADRIAILYGGRLQQLGRTGELLAQSDRLRVELDRGDRDPAAVAAEVQSAIGAEGLEVSIPSARLESLFREVVANAEAGKTSTAGARQGGPIAEFLLGGQAPVSAAEQAPAPVAPQVEPEAPAEEDPAAPASTDAPRVESLTAGSPDSSDVVGDLGGSDSVPAEETPEEDTTAEDAEAAESGSDRLPSEASAESPSDGDGQQPHVGAGLAPAPLPEPVPVPANPVLAKLMGVAAAAPEPSVAPVEVHAGEAPVIEAESEKTRALLARLVPGAQPLPRREPERIELPVSTERREVSAKGLSVLGRIVPKDHAPDRDR